MRTISNLHDSECAAFYHWPPLWIGTPPIEKGENLTPDLLSTEVVFRELACGVELKVSKVGLFVFNFAQWPNGSTVLSNTSHKEWEDLVFARIRFMNLFLACFYTSLKRIQNLSTAKLFIDYTTYAPSRSFSLNLGHLQPDVRQHAVIRSGQEWHVQFKPTCTTVSEEVVQSSADMTDEAILRGSDAALLAELLLQAFQLHETRRYEASHIAAWTIAERCLNQLWTAHLDTLNEEHTPPVDEEKKFISRERRDKLTGRDFTASIISEVLSLSGILPFDDYKLLSEVRKARNDWLHKMITIDKVNAGKAIQLAQLMMRRASVLDMDIPFDVFRSLPLAVSSE